MPEIIDHETMNVNKLPAIWSPVQWEQSDQEREQEVEEQARASLLWAADVPEAVLRMLLNEVEVMRVHEPPEGYDPDEQGDWNPELTTFAFRRWVRLENIQRDEEGLTVEYSVQDLGRWVLDVEAERVTIERI